jgi:glutamine amidotransferase
MVRIGIVDYGMGNLLSVFHAFNAAGADVQICRSPGELERIDRIVLPGVGAFRNGMANLRHRGFIDALKQAVFRVGKPIMGICLGMQAMARRSFEGGECPGLAWLDADVIRLHPNDPSLRIPQIGWNEVRAEASSPFFSGLPQAPDFYFVHSYYMKCDDGQIVEASCDYGGPVTAAVRWKNIFATQFHPEKSQEHGLQVIWNFLRWNP